MFAIKRYVSVHASRRALCQSSLRPLLALGRSNDGRLRFSTSTTRNAKRVSKKQAKDLLQGPLKSEPLPPSDKDELRQESLIDMVKNVMRRFPDCIVLTKVGKFYELYDTHAKKYAPKLGLRIAGKGKDATDMAGFQEDYLNRYLNKMVNDLDKKVVVVEEYKEYDKNGKLITPIQRKVTRVHTPGTFIDDDFADQDKNNFLLSVYCEPETTSENIMSDDWSRTYALAWTDISTGEFFVQMTTRTSLAAALMRIGANEVVLSPSITGKTREEIALSSGLVEDRLVSKQLLPEQDPTSWMLKLDRPMDEVEQEKLTGQELRACQQLFAYLDEQLLDFRNSPQPPIRKEESSTMVIDRSSIRGLELLKTARDGYTKGSLINAIQRTQTQGGTRLLKDRLLYPSISTTEIEYRLDLVQAFITHPDLQQTLIAYLKSDEICDTMRLVNRVDRGYGNAEDLLRIAKAIDTMESMIALLDRYAQTSSLENDEVDAIQTALKLLTSNYVPEGSQQLSAQIQASIDEESISAFELNDDVDDTEAEVTSEEAVTASSTANNGSPVPDATFPLVMRRSASTELDNLHDKLGELNNSKHGLQTRIREELGTPKLVLKFDKKYGHICSTPKSKAFAESAVSAIGGSMVGNLLTVKNFYLADWTKLGRQIDVVKYEIRVEEKRIFDILQQLVTANLVPLRQNAAVLHEIDLATSFATLANEEGWVRPKISSKPIHNIIGGRHPTVRLGLKQKGQSFVENDLHLDRKARAWFITGPNMAGKSTFLRQNALITILAQMGSYVPAEYAEIGVVDKIFSRIGAADDLFRNESTFMVEMLETASILRDATAQSFVIMDEVGRGTAPEDGAAVAFAALHHLYHKTQCRTLFATHFHELAHQTQNWPNLEQHCTDLYENEAGGFTFVHKLRPGVNRKSHALKVAQLAGVPTSALDIAREVLKQNARQAHPDVQTVANLVDGL